MLAWLSRFRIILLTVFVMMFRHFSSGNVIWGIVGFAECRNVYVVNEWLKQMSLIVRSYVNPACGDEGKSMFDNMYHML
jgi:hypothetical protein